MEFRDDVAQVVEAAERAGDSWQPAVTDFQPPPVVALAGVAVAQLAGIGCVAWGGYPQANPLISGHKAACQTARLTLHWAALCGSAGLRGPRCLEQLHKMPGRSFAVAQSVDDC